MRFKKGDKVVFTEKARKKFDNPEYGCEKFHKDWNKVKKLPYAIFLREDCGECVFIKHMENWFIHIDEIEPFTDLEYEWRNINEEEHFYFAT